MSVNIVYVVVVDQEQRTWEKDSITTQVIKEKFLEININNMYIHLVYVQYTFKCTYRLYIDAQFIHVYKQ